MKGDAIFRQFRPLCSRSILLVVSCLAAMLIAAPFAGAQSTGGRIRGTVMDPSGGAVPAATVTLINEATHATREVQSGANGEYIFIEVPIGSYEIDLTLQGFKKYVRKGVVLDLNQVLSVDIGLQLGGSTDVVEVTGAPPVIDTTSTTLGAIVNERAATELPLAERDTYQLLQLQPGVMSSLNNDLFYGSDRPGVVTVNGGRQRDNNYTVNGGDGNDQFANLPQVQPSPDSIEEFRVLTNTFDAEYGRNSGAVVNVVTKSGTNDWHGNVYEFFRNKSLNARGFFDVTKPDYLQNQFGGTFGGPIKKDKTFFFASYEGNRLRKGISSDQVTVPTDAERVGNFSADTTFGGTLMDQNFANILAARTTGSTGRTCQQAVTANSGATIAGGTAYSSIFPNNQVPIECLDATALDLLNQFVPHANVGSSTFQAVPLRHERANQFTVKIDHELTKNQHLTGYYYFTPHFLAKPFAKFQAGGANLPGFGDLTDERFQQINIGHTWTISTTAVNEARFTYFREGQGTFLHPQHTNLVQNSCTSAVTNCFTDPNNTRLGITPNLGSTREGVPFVSVSGGFSFGNNLEGELPQTGQTFSWSDNFSKVLGSHSLKFGGDIRYQKFDQELFFDLNGDYTYFGGGSNDPGTSNLFPNYLLGLPDSYLQGSAQFELVRSKSYYLFGQDSWKIKPNVTLNYGLRWELNTPMADAGKKVQTFRPGHNTTIYPCKLGNLPATTTPNPLITTFGTDNCTPGSAGATPNSISVFPTGLVVPGDAGIPNGLTATYYKAFAPRLGLNWSPGYKDGPLAKLFGGPGKTSVRMGWGMFYNPVEQLVLEQFSAEPPFGGSSSVSTILFNTPFLGQGGTQFPNPFNGILNPPRSQPVDWSLFRPIVLFGQLQPKERSQYAIQYNFGIEREIVKDLVLTVTYVGRQGHRLLATHDLNFANAQTCLDLIDLGQGCGSFLEDSSFFIPSGTVISTTSTNLLCPGGLLLPYNAGPGGRCVPNGSTVGPNGITLVGVRPYSSPNCQPTTGVGCPPDGIPVFGSIFAQDNIANSAYNALQVMAEKRFSHGLQFQGSYTFGKSIDNASSFENLLNPLNPRANRSLSLFDARHRFVFNYFWELPIPKKEGAAGKLLNGWSTSAIVAFQSGFPIRITSQSDLELQNSFDFELPGEPNILGTVHPLDPRQTTCALGTGPNAGPNNPNAPGPPPTCVPIHAAFDPNLFTNATVPLGTIGNSPRSVCCGPGLNNFDFGFQKNTQLSERTRLQFRADILNIFNHAGFTLSAASGGTGNITNGQDFSRINHARDPRLIQFALKLYF
jgi:hypothetical protein